MAATQRATRWYAHGWNTPLSWELILRITPRLPRIILIPLRHIMTLVCFITMFRERAAVRRNLQHVTGKTGFANLRLAYRLFFNFSRLLVSYTELRQLDPEVFEGRLVDAAVTDHRIKAALAEGRGALILTMHLGHWDLGLKLLSRYQVPVNVVMMSKEPAEVARYAEEARACPELKVHQMGSSSFLAVDLVAALKRGEVVALQADRPVGQNTLDTPLFGTDTPLPTGPVQLAMATGAPILPIFVLMEQGRKFRLVAEEPMRFERVRGDRSGPALREAMNRVAAMMESVIARYPDQWFNFYDVWRRPEEGQRGDSAMARLKEILFRRHTEPGRLSLAVGMGVFIGFTPFYGLHTVIGLALAWVLRLNLTVTVLATQVANPLFAPFLIALSVWLGTLLGNDPTLSGTSLWDPTASAFYLAWLRGGLILGLALGSACGALTFALVSRVRRRTHEIRP